MEQIKYLILYWYKALGTEIPLYKTTIFQCSVYINAFNEHPYLIEPYASMHRYASIVYSTVQSLETTAAFMLFAIGTNVSAYVYTA